MQEGLLPVEPHRLQAEPCQPRGTPRPRIVKALSDPLATAERGYALLPTKARMDDPDLFLGRVVFARLALDASDQLVSGIL